MALHGSIEINNQRIGYWYAQRILTSQFGNHTYRWEAWRDGHHVTGDLRHQYNDGAMMLAAKVLAFAHAALEAKWPQTPAAEATLPASEPVGPVPRAGEPCARCGSTETRASIDGLRYCHGEQRPSCYELAQWESRGIVAAEATLPAVTPPAPEPHSGKGEGSDAHREARRRARAAFAELRRIDPPCSCPEQTYLDRVATYTAPAGVEPHAATCPRNGQLEGDRLDWLAADYPATQWASEGGRG